MTLEQLSYIGQTVAAVAVLFSLAAVYGQVRQTNKIARADLTHSVWLQAGQMNRVSSYTTPRGTTLNGGSLTFLIGAKRLRIYTTRHN